RFSTMPPHPEVPAALRKLRDAGFRLFTLTDNLLEVQTRQLEHGGILDLFERRFSADGVKDPLDKSSWTGWGRLARGKGHNGGVGRIRQLTLAEAGFEEERTHNRRGALVAEVGV